jgi:hypothetical protein
LRRGLEFPTCEQQGAYLREKNMHIYDKDYIEFENKYLKELTLLWHDTKDELLRTKILELRAILHQIYVTSGKRYSVFDLDRS